MNRLDQMKYLINSIDPTFPVPSNEADCFQVLRGLMNIRMPEPISDVVLKVQDEFLKNEIEQSGIVDIKDLSPIKNNPTLYLWKGDITRLKVDAIVNAANLKLLGCFIPSHKCIDNAIHTYAGMQLRLACDEIMKKKNKDEETGKAVLTKAYNLPSKFIIHTVGPIVYNQVTQLEKDQLKSCYTEIIKLAEAEKLTSVAFCCISTGEFRFPNELAASIAIKTVREKIKDCKYVQKVIFNVFKEEDYEIYKRLLK